MALLPDQLAVGDLVLSRWDLGFLDDVMSAVGTSFTELHRWMAWADVMPTREAMSEVIAEGIASFDADLEWQYFLRQTSTGEIVGGAGLHRRAGPKTLEVGYWVRTNRTGYGYATSAARILTDAAFSTPTRFDRVEIHMDRANLASVAVPRKLGFSLEREEDREVITPGHSGRGFVWAMDREDWALMRSA